MTRPARRRVVPEKVEQAHIVQLLRSIGSAVYVLGTRRPAGDYQGTRQTLGISDLLVFLPRGAGVLFVEVKSKRGRLRPEQWEFALRCQAIGQPVYHVVGGLDAVIAELVKLELLRPDQVPHYRLDAANSTDRDGALQQPGGAR